MASWSLLLLLVLGTLLHPGAPASSIERVSEDPRYPDQCRDSVLGRFFPNGARWTHKGFCLERYCNFPYISTDTCGSVSVDPPCELVSDLSLPYPDCCPQPRCPTEDLDYNNI